MEIKNTSKIKDLYNYYYGKCSGLSIDTRSIEKNQMFFALKGPNFDGHKYIDVAFEKGAKFCVIDDSKYSHIENVVLVENVEKSLQDLARYHRLQLNIPVLCLTGSNGKTTTKELIASVLSERYSVFATKGNLNNHLGVPISILSITKDIEIAVIELGANHQGEIEFLSEIAMPQYGMITNIGKAHLEGFGGVEGVKNGKTELFRYLEKVDGFIFYDTGDEKIVQSIPQSIETRSYSISDIEIVQGFPNLSLKYKGLQIASMLSGEYNVLNILAAIKIGEFFHLDVKEVIKGIESYIPKNNRSQIIESDRNTIIMDAYNANPSSMQVSISNLANSNSQNKVLVLGHMLELGDSSSSEHLALLQYVDNYNWQSIYIIGNEFEPFKNREGFQYFQDVSKLDNYIKENPITNSTILIKGSRGVTLEKLLPSL